MKSNLLSLIAVCAIVPLAGQAQDRMTCGDYLAMDAEAKIAAIESVKTQLLEAGQGFRFDAGEGDDVKVAYVDSECTNADAWAGLALFDVLGK